MAIISREDVLHVGKLSKLKPSEAEAARLETQFGNILQYMERLNEVDTNGVEPLYSPLENKPAVRKDKAHRTCTREELLANSPADDDQFFVVPKVI